MHRFSEKNIIVTGAGAGIGLAAVQAFAAEGARVLAVDRDPAILGPGAGLPPEATACMLDITDEAAVAQAVNGFGQVDILFNCAGIVHSGRVDTTSPADFERVFKVNVTGTFLMSRAVLPGMVARRSGCILNMASVVSSLRGLPDRFAYGASKAAVIGMTKSIAADYVSVGLRCNAICPGTVDTPSLRARLEATGDYAAALRAFTQRQPMGRLASASEIAGLVLYLASDAASFVTGQAISIDGGMTI